MFYPLESGLFPPPPHLFLFRTFYRARKLLQPSIQAIPRLLYQSFQGASSEIDPLTTAEWRRGE